MVRSRIAVLVAVAAAASIGGWQAGRTRPSLSGPVVVTAVFDGDTVEVAGEGRREIVRLLGVDTPETVHPARPVECFGPEASAFTTAALLGRVVRLRFDRVRRDRYDRLLAFVEVDGQRVNDALLREGYARLLLIPPNDAAGRRLLRLELEARAAGRGLWGACQEQEERGDGDQPRRWYPTGRRGEGSAPRRPGLAQTVPRQPVTDLVDGPSEHLPGL